MTEHATSSTSRHYGKVKHWKYPDAERTLCGRLPKNREIDPEWPVCKTCDKATRYMTRTYKFPEMTEEERDEAIARDVEKNPDAKFRVFFTSMSVTEIPDKPKRKRAS